MELTHVSHGAQHLVVMNLALRRLVEATLPTDVEVTLVEWSGPHHDPADHVLTYPQEHPNINRLVIGVKHRTPAGKAVFGSLSQRLLLGGAGSRPRRETRTRAALTHPRQRTARCQPKADSSTGTRR
jgi:hypothetical protein